MFRTLGDAVARVETPDGPYSLRVNLPGSAERQREIHGFLTLANAAGLHVPTPLPDLEGLTISPMPEGRTAVLASWVTGVQASSQMSPALATEIGRVTARLHALYSTPEPWHGPVLDAAWLRGWWRDMAPEHLTSADVGRCLPTIEHATIWLEAHAHEFQVIHADLHFGNLLALPGGEAGILDFGECALAHPAFDLAMTEGEFMDFEEGPDYVAAYRAAYAAETGKAYPLRARELMTACTATSFLEWVYGSENEEVREQKLKWIPALVERLAGDGRKVEGHWGEA
ncbi:phosphotransferase [Deinococcus sp.]|uniref:phosphotransferase enzyme family protein n=1 Tax=Deinococcus sp. TaxID=47478 RepID=UPI00286E6A76|nr:phosphotransferase [Deinococcus sp.]